MKAASKELGSLRQSLTGDAWSLEVLCAKFMKRKTLYCCTADPDRPVGSSSTYLQQGQPHSTNLSPVPIALGKNNYLAAF